MKIYNLSQLNMYGFHKQKHPESQNYFQHQSYRRGQNLGEIKRKPEKKKKQSGKNGTQINIYGQNQGEQSNRDNSNSQFPTRKEKQNEQNIPIKQKLEEQYLKSESILHQQGNEQEINSSNQQMMGNNLSQICEQALLQNQVLRTVDSILKQQSITLKKLRLQEVKQEQKRYHKGSEEEQSLNHKVSKSTIQEEDNGKQMIVSRVMNIWDIIKAETLKINMQIDFYPEEELR